jgi:hypothetical protein
VGSTLLAAVAERALDEGITHFNAVVLPASSGLSGSHAGQRSNHFGWRAELQVELGPP